MTTDLNWGSDSEAPGIPTLPVSGDVLTISADHHVSSLPQAYLPDSMDFAGTL